MNVEAQETAPPRKGKSLWSSGYLILFIVILAVGVTVAAAGAIPSSGGLHYACITATKSGSDVDVSTTGIIHHLSSEYYIGCPEGGTTATVPASLSCLTITPVTTVPPYPGSSTAIAYHLTAPGGSIAIQGAPANSTVLTQPNSAMVVVSCG